MIERPVGMMLSFLLPDGLRGCLIHVLVLRSGFDAIDVPI
jgi:hypothetical protein